MMAVSLPSRVRAVTVYRKGAEVTRVAVIEAGSAGFAPEVELTGFTAYNRLCQMCAVKTEPAPP